MLLTRSILIIAVVNLLLVEGNQSPPVSNSYPPSQYNFPPPNDPYDPRQQQQPIPQTTQHQFGGQPSSNPYGNIQQPFQQPFQQQQHQQQSPPNPYGNPPPPRGASGGAPTSGMGGPGYGQLAPYGRGPPPPQQQEQGAAGLFSKLKNTIKAAGNAIAGGPDLPPPPGYGRPGPGGPPPGYGGPQGGRPQPGQFGGPSPGQGQGQGRPGQGGPPQYGSPNRPQITHSQGPPGGRPGQQGAGEGGGVVSGLFGKFKNMFSGDEAEQNVPSRRPPGPPGAGYGYGQQQKSPGPSPGMYGPPPPRPGPGQMPLDDIYSRGPPPPPPQQQQQQQPGFGRPSSPYGDFAAENPYRQQQQQQQPPQPGATDMFGSSSGFGSSDSTRDSYAFPPPPPPPPPPSVSSSMSDLSSSSSSYPFPADPSLPSIMPPVLSSPELLIPSEPQIFSIEDSIVMILKPRNFLKKKIEISNAGSNGLQVFSDFEHVFTKFRSSSANAYDPHQQQQQQQPIENMRSFSTAEILESSPALLPQAVNALRQVADKYENQDMDEQLFEEYTSSCHQIIAQEGGLHINSVPPLTRDYIDKLCLRDGWKESLQSLASQNVPTFLFSSGYGDIVQQTLLQGGVGEHGTLPQNLRIISNFFKTAPDGSVRAFSTPIVHERNKNATTAARFMGFAVPERPYALIFGSHEDDVHMAENVPGLKASLSVGFLEMTDDLLQRLPTFLSAYDAVVVSDGSFQYIRSVIDELLQIPTQPASKQHQRGGLEKKVGQYFDIFG